MPLPVIPHVFRVVWHWSNVNIPRAAVNVMHFSISSDDPSTLFAAFVTASAAKPWIQTTVDSKIVSVDITPLDGAGLTETFVPTPGTGWEGVQPSGPCMPAVAAVLKLTTNTRGRSYRGRIFMPWVAELAADNGSFTPSVYSASVTSIAAWFAALTGAGADPQIASYHLGTAAPVTAMFLERSMATQRRRQLRTG